MFQASKAATRRKKRDKTTRQDKTRQQVKIIKREKRSAEREGWSMGAGEETGARVHFSDVH